MSVLSMIMAGGMGSGLGVLTEQRGKPAVPFGGKYRLIDFPLSNIVNSYLSRVAVLVQFNAHSLIEHLGTGEPWELNQRPNGLQVWQAYIGRTDSARYSGTADAVYQNRKFIAEDGSEMLLIIAGDHIYKQDYREMIRFHQEKGGELTISSMQVPLEEAHHYGLMVIDENQRITQFIEKPEKPELTLASMGIYIFNTAYLLRLLEADASDPASSHDFGKNIISKVVQQGQAYAYPYSGYWADIGTVRTYYETNLALLGDKPPIDLYDSNWVIHTRSAEKAPVKVRQPGQVIDSLVSDGCVIEGEVVNSVLSPGVRVERGAVVRDSVILNDAIIRGGAVVDRSIVDMQVEVGQNARIGSGDDLTPNQAEPEILNSGITVIGMQTRIPPGAVLGRNVRVDGTVTPADFETLEVPSGSTIHHR